MIVQSEKFDKIKMMYDVVGCGNVILIKDVDNYYYVVDICNGEMVRCGKYRHIRMIGKSGYVCVEVDNAYKGIISIYNEFSVPTVYKEIEIVDNDIALCKRGGGNEFIDIYSLQRQYLFNVVGNDVKIHTTSNGYLIDILSVWNFTKNVLFYNEREEMVCSAINYDSYVVYDDKIWILYDGIEDYRGILEIVNIKTKEIVDYTDVYEYADLVSSGKCDIDYGTNIKF